MKLIKFFKRFFCRHNNTEESWDYSERYVYRHWKCNDCGKVKIQKQNTDMIKAKINSTGEVVNVRPYQTEIHDFMVCRNDGIMGELYMRSELTIIGDNELDFVSLVKKMREAQEDVIYKSMFSALDFARPTAYEVAKTKQIALEQEVDEYLKKMKGVI